MTQYLHKGESSSPVCYAMCCATGYGPCTPGFPSVLDGDTLSLPYTQGTDLSVQVVGWIKLSLLLSCRPLQVAIYCVGGHQIR